MRVPHISSPEWVSRARPPPVFSHHVIIKTGHELLRRLILQNQPKPKSALPESAPPLELSRENDLPDNPNEWNADFGDSDAASVAASQQLSPREEEVEEVEEVEESEEEEEEGEEEEIVAKALNSQPYPLPF